MSVCVYPCLSVLQSPHGFCVASEMAVNEIKSLREKLDMEQTLRREAENIAHQVKLCLKYYSDY